MEGVNRFIFVKPWINFSVFDMATSICFCVVVALEFLTTTFGVLETTNAEPIL